MHYLAKFASNASLNDILELKYLVIPKERHIVIAIPPTLLFKSLGHYCYYCYFS